ncbi:TIGR03084 family metal-binding protein [Amycolatopsis sp. cmx-11-51]|uniref:TIGR03084 family metal-binding protein n=1 Tax=unclassified Amycolatopsis TaxID=2618356 RepID=UPI0039E22DE4
MNGSPDVFDALRAEGDAVDGMVAGLDAEQWRAPTPAPGWTVAHQIAHLTATFRMAGLAGSAPDRFVAVMSELDDDFTKNVANALAEYLAEPPDVLLERWRLERESAAKALEAVPAGTLVPWLVNPLPAQVLASAGIMELFAHGQDIADALGVDREHDDLLLGHLTAFGARTWTFGYLSRGLPVPETEFRFELTSPSGTTWVYGPEDAPQRIAGQARDFCLLVTRRRHRDDLAVTASGDVAEHWLDIAQAYRGPAGEGREPGQHGRGRRPNRKA